MSASLTMARASWLHPLNDVAALDDLLGLVNPMWSLREIRAEVESVVQETPDTRSFWLRPNRHWPGFRAGQHLRVGFESGGVRHQRVYSLSSDPRQSDRIRITVRRQTGGRMSGLLHDHAAPGTVLRLGLPEGDFVLPESPPERLLMIAGGSGVTPLMSQVLALRGQGWSGDLALVMTARGREGFIFGAALEAIACDWPSLRLHWHDSRADGRLDLDALLARVPDAARRPAWLCGPYGLMAGLGDARAARVAAGEGWAPLQVERFGPPPRPVVSDAAGPVRIRVSGVAQKEQVFTAQPGQPLLEAAEAAGLSPRHGCRAGICRSCQCRKLHGRVRNHLTGVVSDAPDELIPICVSSACSDVELAI